MNFTAGAFATPITPEYIWSFSEEEMGIFHSIPYWDILMRVALLSLLIVVAVSMIKNFHKT